MPKDSSSIVLQKFMSIVFFKSFFSYSLHTLIQFIHFCDNCNDFIYYKHILSIWFNYTIGKSFLLKNIANHAVELGLNVCVSAPTGKLASKYVMELPMRRCNTVHTNYFIPVGKTKQPYAISWGLSDVHILLVEEVIKLSNIVVHTLAMNTIH